MQLTGEGSDESLHCCERRPVPLELFELPDALSRGPYRSAEQGDQNREDRECQEKKPRAQTNARKRMGHHDS
jgi:hypothetical protein